MANNPFGGVLRRGMLGAHGNTGIQMAGGTSGGGMSPQGAFDPSLATEGAQPSAGRGIIGFIQNQGAQKRQAQATQQAIQYWQQTFNKNYEAAGGQNDPNAWGKAMHQTAADLAKENPAAMVALAPVFRSGQELAKLTQEGLKAQQMGNQTQMANRVVTVPGPDGKPLFMEIYDATGAMVDRKNVREEMAKPVKEQALANEANARGEYAHQQGLTEEATRNALLGGGPGGEMQPGTPRYSVAQARANYQMEGPTAGMGGTKTQAMKIAQLNDILQLNPKYDQNRYQAYRKAEDNWFSGGPTSDAGTVASAQRLTQHLGVARLAQEALANPTDSKILNAIRNKWNEAFGSEMPTNVQALGGPISVEAAKFLSGQGGSLSEPEREALTKSITQLNGSPDQQKGAIDQLKGLMMGQLSGEKGKYDTAFQGHPLYEGKFNEKMNISPEIQQMMEQGVDVPGGTIKPGGIVPGPSPSERPSDVGTQAQQPGVSNPLTPGGYNPKDPLGVNQ